MKSETSEEKYYMMRDIGYIVFLIGLIAVWGYFCICLYIEDKGGTPNPYYVIPFGIVTVVSYIIHSIGRTGGK